MSAGHNLHFFRLLIVFSSSNKNNLLTQHWFPWNPYLRNYQMCPYYARPYRTPFFRKFTQHSCDRNAGCQQFSGTYKWRQQIKATAAAIDARKCRHVGVSISDAVQVSNRFCIAFGRHRLCSLGKIARKGAESGRTGNSRFLVDRATHGSSFACTRSRL